MISDEQLSRIKNDIEQSGIAMQSLKDDLCDHFCCTIERHLKNGLSFHDAYSLAKEQICPNGFKEIERETIFLLNSKKTMAMKKIIYSIGLLTAISISLGYLFIVLHWAGGPELFNYGFLGFLLLFIPLLAIDRYKHSIRKNLSERMRLLLGISSALIAGFAVLFKFLHYTGADVLLVVGFTTFTFGFLPFQFFKMYKRSLD